MANNEIEECTICLEEITNSSFIGLIQSCRHYYHDHCLLQWSSNSNSCPTCRKLFYKIEIKRKGTSKTVYKSIEVKDKLLPNDAINDISSEFIIPGTVDFHSSSSQNTTGGICMICSSSEYRSNMEAMILCYICNSSFHSNCLGLTSTGECTQWYCPICDSQQDYQSTYNEISSSFPSERRINKEPNLGSANKRRTRTVKLPGLTRRMVTMPETIDVANCFKRRPGLIIHNENDELDDDFLYSDNVSQNMNNKPIINGGVILRKEMERRKHLSREEAQSWDLFEQVRVGSSSTIIEREPSDNSSNRIRRKKLTPVVKDNMIKPNYEITREKSRISDLISQMKSTGSEENSDFGNLSSGKSVLSSMPQSLPLCDNRTKQDIQKEMNPSSPNLSFKHKMEIQKHVRNKLKPLYHPVKPPQQSMELNYIISSEENYININRNISRKIYSHILTESHSAGERAVARIEQIFSKDNKRLQGIIDMYANEELKYYNQ